MPSPGWGGRRGADVPEESGVFMADGSLEPRAGRPGLRLELRLELVDVRRRHLPRRLDVTVLDPPEAERSGDVAEAVKLDRADDADIPDGLARLQEVERFPELGRAGMDDHPAR